MTQPRFTAATPAKKHISKVRQDAIASEGKQHANPNVNEVRNETDQHYRHYRRRRRQQQHLHHSPVNIHHSPFITTTGRRFD